MRILLVVLDGVTNLFSIGGFRQKLRYKRNGGEELLYYANDKSVTDYNFSFSQTPKSCENEEKPKETLKNRVPLLVNFKLDPSCGDGEVLNSVDETTKGPWVQAKDREIVLLEIAKPTDNDNDELVVV